MMKILYTHKVRLLAFAMLFCCIFAANAQETPVQKHGQLKIFNGKVSDQNNNPVVLRGMSLFWSGFPEGSPFYNAQTVKWLRDDWCVDVVRAAMSVETGNTNYVGNASQEMAKIKTVIDACVANGLYVIVDFHTHEANNYKAQAKTFFTEIANTYGHLPNILYEPYNEPISHSWSGTIKPYMTELISTIRAIDPDNIIISGTRNYSQEVLEAANDPLVGTNIAYTLHYYANTHQQSLRDKAKQALDKGIAIFVTEYGTTNASGQGGYNPTESQNWWNFLEANKISSANWSVSNKWEESAILTSGNNKLSDWTDADLKASGLLVKNYIKGKCNVDVTTGSITLSFAGGKTQYALGEQVSITANTTVANGTIAKVEFYRGSTLLVADATSPYTYQTTTMPAGGHNITAKSFDASGNLIAESPIYLISVVGASNISTTGVTDQFETVEQYSEITGGSIGTGTGCTGLAAAATGVFWFEDRNAATPFKSEATRTGDGTLTYLISQEAGAYEVIGFGFGEYCENGVRKKYSLDLTNNAVLNLTVSAPESNTVSMDLKFQMKDADGTVIAINDAYLQETTPGNWYMYEIGYSKNHGLNDFPKLDPGMTSNFTFDFKNALSVNNPNNPTYPDDINPDNSDFDFSKVTEVVIVPVNAADAGSPTWAPLAYTDQQIIFSGLSLGDPAAGTDICTTPSAVTAADRTYCQNSPDATALTATGMEGLQLKWYTSPTGGTASELAPIPSTAVPGVTNYYVTQAPNQASTCEAPRTEITVTIVEAPTADAGLDQTAATGPSVTLNGSGSATGTWTNVTKPTGATITFSPSSNTASVTANGLTEVGEYVFQYSVNGTTPCAAATADVVVNVTTVTATNSASLAENSVEVYPNPVTDNLYINLSKVDGTKSVKVVDMLGRVIYESTNENTINVETSDLSKGMYYIQVQSDFGHLTKSFLKK